MARAPVTRVRFRCENFQGNFICRAMLAPFDRNLRELARADTDRAPTGTCVCVPSELRTGEGRKSDSEIRNGNSVYRGRKEANETPRAQLCGGIRVFAKRERESRSIRATIRVMSEGGNFCVAILYPRFGDYDAKRRRRVDVARKRRL